jgi:hypothetical protein
MFSVMWYDFYQTRCVIYIPSPRLGDRKHTTCWIKINHITKHGRSFMYAIHISHVSDRTPDAPPSLTSMIHFIYRNVENHQNIYQYYFCKTLPHGFHNGFARDPQEKGWGWAAQDSRQTPACTSKIIFQNILNLHNTVTFSSQIAALKYTRWRLNRRVGVMCLLVYAVYILFSVMIECNVFGFVNPPMCDWFKFIV